MGKCSYKYSYKQSYRQIPNELTKHDSILIRKNRIVLPQSLRKKAIEITLQGHSGYVKLNTCWEKKYIGRDSMQM